MAKQTKEQEQAQEPAQPETPMVKVRRGRYVGPQSRGYDSVPFGERFLARPGEMYDVRESFRYLWEDAEHSKVWEWEAGVIEVPAVNEGQVAPPK